MVDWSATISLDLQLAWCSTRYHTFFKCCGSGFRRGFRWLLSPNQI